MSSRQLLYSDPNNNNDDLITKRNTNKPSERTSEYLNIATDDTDQHRMVFTISPLHTLHEVFWPRLVFFNSRTYLRNMTLTTYRSSWLNRLIIRFPFLRRAIDKSRWWYTTTTTIEDNRWRRVARGRIWHRQCDVVNTESVRVSGNRGDEA